MAEKLDALPAGTLGSYQVRSKIGSGGMGDVFDAVHTGLDKRVAIKTLRKRFLDDDVVVARFLREGQLAARLRHPHIVDVTDVGMMGGLPCLVMEFLEGESLSQLIRREGKLPLDRVVDLVLPIIAAIDFAHDHGILHRDLKPSNIFLARSWNGEIVPKVVDFGISKLVHEAQEAALTTDSAFVGTPHYASPESMRADKQADGRSDQYSMGVILYEAATGIRPFVDLGNNFVALAMAICKGEYPPARDRNPDIPVAFDNVIKRAMSLQAEDRFLTMRALGQALLPFASERARVIWGPSFVGQSGEAPVLGELRPPSAASATMQVSSPSTVVTGPSQPPPSFPSTTPPGAAFDRLPTYNTYGTGQPVAAPRKSGLIPAVIGASVVLAITVSLVILKGGVLTTAKTSEPTVATVATVAPASYAVDLAITPANASITLDGATAGTGRLVRTMPKDGKTHQLVIAAPGYETITTDFDDGRPPPAALALRPLPAPAPAPAPAAAPATGRAAAGNGKKGNSGSRPKTDNIDPWE